MSTINQLLHDQPQDQNAAGEPTASPLAGGDSIGPYDPCCTPPGPDPGPDR